MGGVSSGFGCWSHEWQCPSDTPVGSIRRPVAHGKSSLEDPGTRLVGRHPSMGAVGVDPLV